MKDRLRAKLQSTSRRLFFYSSRQLARRTRTYLSVFITSVVLLILVSTALMLFESYYLHALETSATGIYHVMILSQPNDLGERIAAKKGVKTCTVVPYSSILASSEDAQKLGKVVARTEELEETLGITYVWGRAPEDGEIAIPLKLYQSYRYFKAGEETELFFKGPNMIYEPMPVSGVFLQYDEGADYVLVSPATEAKISRQTGAKPKYDHYILLKHSGDTYAAKTAKELIADLHVVETEEQSVQPPVDSIYSLEEEYKMYVNMAYNAREVSYQATPVVLYSLPVIAVAALMLASFVTNWTRSHASEFGVLAALGATPVDICVTVTGQIFIITLLSAVPVLPVSALLSQIYIRAFNAAAVGYGYVYTIPWGNLFKVILWFVLLSSLFTVLGIRSLARADAFPLISGAVKGRIPFVKKSRSRFLSGKNPVRRLAFLQAVRRIRGDIPEAVISVLLSLTLSVSLLYYISTFSGDPLENLYSSSSADTVISSGNTFHFTNRVVPLYTQKTVPLYAEDAERLSALPGVASVRARNVFQGKEIYGAAENAEIVSPRFRLNEYWRSVTVYSVNAADMETLAQYTFSGDPKSLYEGERRVIVVTPDGTLDSTPVSAGDRITLTPKTVFEYYRPETQKEPDFSLEYTVAAVMSPGPSQGTCLLLTPEGAAELGLCGPGEFSTFFINYEPGLTQAQLDEVLTAIASDPVFLRYEIVNLRVETSMQRTVSQAKDLLFALFVLDLYVSFCLSVFMHFRLKAQSARQELGVLRQIGADDGQVLATMRPASDLLSGLVFAVILVLMLGLAFTIISEGTRRLNIVADIYWWIYTPEVYAKNRREIFQTALVALGVLLGTLPFQAVSYFVSRLGVTLHMRRSLRESIADSIRRDTD